MGDRGFDTMTACADSNGLVVPGHYQRVDMCNKTGRGMYMILASTNCRANTGGTMHQ